MALTRLQFAENLFAVEYLEFINHYSQNEIFQIESLSTR